jgi:hypothetical protein
MGEFVDFSRMTAEQQQQVCEHLTTKTMTPEQLNRWKFYVRDDGTVTRQKGCHKMTEETEREYNEEIARFYRGPAPSKDQPIAYKVGTTFSTSRG